jgi:hypothetical protein
VNSDERLRAERYLASESAELRALRTWTRTLWNAAEALAPEGDAPTAAQVVLHRDAVVRILREYQPAGFWSGRRRLDDAAAHPHTAEAAALLRDAHRVFLEELEAPLTAAREAQIRRWAGAGAAIFVCAVVALSLLYLVQWVRKPVDLARGKTFTLSSKWTDCHPDEGECGGYPMKILFHTNEQANPWFQWDLGKPTQFSSLTVKNRSDAALMRAVPLVVEVSDDGAHFKEVVRRVEKFELWEPKFPPLTARYVRLRVDRPSTLHLEAIQVHP